MTGHIDAHLHVWALARGDYGWITPQLPALHRDFNLDDIAPLHQQAGVTVAVLVQAAPTMAETTSTSGDSNGSAASDRNSLPKTSW